jgi:hypothetical protein
MLYATDGQRWEWESKTNESFRLSEPRFDEKGAISITKRSEMHFSCRTVGGVSILQQCTQSLDIP